MVIFTPDSWRKGGSAVEQGGTTFSSSVSGKLSGLQNTGAEGGIAMIDGLIAGILPAVLEAVNATVDGISTGLASEAAALIATGDSYAEVEDAAAELGNFMEGEY